MSGTITVPALSDAEIKRNAGDGGAYRDSMRSPQRLAVSVRNE